MQEQQQEEVKLGRLGEQQQQGKWHSSSRR